MACRYASWVEHSHFHSVTEGAVALADDDIHILYEAVVGDVIVCDVVLDILDATVVADGDVVQRGVEYTGVFVDSTSHLEAVLELADFDVATEACATNIFKTRSVADEHFCPVLRRASLCFQTLDFFCCELSHSCQNVYFFLNLGANVNLFLQKLCVLREKCYFRTDNYDK